MFILIRYKYAKAPYMRKGNIVRNMSFECFFFLCVFGTKTLKSMESTLNGKTKHNQKRVFWAFLSYIHTKPLKRMKRKHNNFPKKLVIWDFWVRSVQKNAKIHAKYTIWENENKLREKCIMSVFELRYQNVKTYE